MFPTNLASPEVTWGGVYKSYFISFVSATVVFMVAFLLSAIVSSVLTPVSDSSAQTITVENTATGYYVSVTSPDTVELEVDATPVGQIVVSSANTVNVKTNSPLGYKLYLSTENDELTSTDSTITQTFSPVTNTSLTNNTWGFSTDSTTTKSWNAVPEVTSGNESSGYLLASSTTPNIPDGDNIDVYYGINADTTMPSGTYSTTVTYTAISESVIEYPSMQDFTLHDCANLTIGTSTTLKDIRNGANYRITRLADGNCWMTENLRLDGGINLTSDNTNLPSGTSIYLPENIKEGDTVVSTVMQVIRNKDGYDGNLYNWCAATLTGDCSSITTEQTQDICPKGWRLPSNTGTPSYSNLFGYYGLPTSNTSADYISQVEAAPLLFTLAGVYTSIYDSQGSRGQYWSRTPSDTVNAYNFYYNSIYFSPQAKYYKSTGRTVRCAMQLGGTMQSFTATDCQNLELEKSTLLVDTRDNKVYRAARLKDGNCWMTQNLKYKNTNSTNWNTNNYSQQLLHIATNSGYVGEYYYNYTSAINVCPTGWTLPSGADVNTNGSWAHLMSVYGISTGEQLLAQTSLGFEKYYGLWWYVSAAESDQGKEGRFWSSTASSGTSAYYLYYTSAGIAPQNSWNKGMGLTVRCVFR